MHSATIDAISRHSCTPVGSLYHRFGSRDRLLAEMWVRGVRRSQAAFIVAARHREPEQAAVDAALSIYEFVRQHPADARLLTSFRRDDLLRDPRSPGLIRELQQLNQPLEAAVTVLARRVFGKPTRRAVAQTLLATIDIPMGMVRRYLEDRKQAEERMRQENLALREEIDHSSMFEEIVGSSLALRQVLGQVARVAPTDSTVLISGGPEPERN